MSSTISFLSGSRARGDVALKSDGTAGVRSDTRDLLKPAIGFMALADGDIAINAAPFSGPSVVLTVRAGNWYPFHVTRVYNTGTTLTNAQIVLLYGP